MNAVRIGFVALALLAALVIPWGDAAAQNVVQLPEYHVTSVHTTVSVPDGGGTYLGGVNSAAEGSVNQGIPGLDVRPFASSAMSRSNVGGGMWIGAQIHDLQAMDAALLLQTAGSVRPPLAPTPQSIATSGASVADLRAQAAAEDAARQQQAADDLAHGRQLLAEGKSGVAKIYLQMAASHATGDLQRQALAELQALDQPKASVTVSGQAIPR